MSDIWQYIPGKSDMHQILLVYEIANNAGRDTRALHDRIRELEEELGVISDMLTGVREPPKALHEYVSELLDENARLNADTVKIGLLEEKVILLEAAVVAMRNVLGWLKRSLTWDSTHQWWYIPTDDFEAISHTAEWFDIEKWLDKPKESDS